VAVNCWSNPFAIDTEPGVTSMEESSALVTVTATEPDTAPTAAVILAVPTEIPVTRPPVETVALAEFEVLQEASAVMSCVLPSE